MKTLSLFNIQFINGNFYDVLKLLEKRKFMVVPSAPGLATIDKDLRYNEAVINSDFAIPDSGYMIILLRLFRGIKIKKLSGYKFLKLFFEKKKFKKNELFLIDPSSLESKKNKKYLNDLGISLSDNQQYIAPIYDGKIIEDYQLIRILNSLKEKPKYIIINLGSGIQEPLGWYLKQNLNFSSSIICTGAAIAFLNGSQAGISPIIDKLFLGWFWRIFTNPKSFIFRYIKAIRLISLIKKNENERNK